MEGQKAWMMMKQAILLVATDNFAKPYASCKFWRISNLHCFLMKSLVTLASIKPDEVSITKLSILIRDYPTTLRGFYQMLIAFFSVKQFCNRKLLEFNFKCYVEVIWSIKCWCLEIIRNQYKHSKLRSRIWVYEIC